MTIALYHFHATQIKRSTGQSAIAAAAYRAGEKLYSQYYGETADYTRKDGVVCSEIFLPSHAPPEYADRQTLWNAVEEAERHPKAQLAYSFDIALQSEFSMEENIALARQFCLEQFVSRGMIADLAVHQPEKDGIPNPHFHVLCPIRPLDETGKWGAKQRREYVLDENGKRVKDDAGHELFNAVPTTDWGRPETLEAWRKAWADLCNAKFAEKGLACRIDHRSYARQGIEQIPTIHEGPAVRQMEAKGIMTDKGTLNRWIRKTNALLREGAKVIAALVERIKEIKDEMSKPAPPMLAECLNAYLDMRNAGAYSKKAKNNNFKRYNEMANYLMSHKLYTVEALDTYVREHSAAMTRLKDRMQKSSARMKELQELLRHRETYAGLKPLADEMNAIRFKGRREKFRQEHEPELRRFYMARRKLKPYVSASGKLPVAEWKAEFAALREEHTASRAEYKTLYDEVKELLLVQKAIHDGKRYLEQKPLPRKSYEPER